MGPMDSGETATGFTPWSFEQVTSRQQGRQSPIERMRRSFAALNPLEIHDTVGQAEQGLPSARKYVGAQGSTCPRSNVASKTSACSSRKALL
jgi:hypothetical protein